jgi:hypothetical protein
VEPEEGAGGRGGKDEDGQGLDHRLYLILFGARLQAERNVRQFLSLYYDTAIAPSNSFAPFSPSD